MQAECQRKHEQTGDYIPIKILAAIVVIDIVEILVAVRASRETCAWLSTPRNTLQWLFLLYSNNTVSYQEGLLLAFWALLTATRSPCAALRVYQSSAAPSTHRAELCYRGGGVCICTLRQCDVKQMHPAGAKYKLAERTRKKFWKLHSKCLQSQIYMAFTASRIHHEMEWLGCCSAYWFHSVWACILHMAINAVYLFVCMRDLLVHLRDWSQTCLHFEEIIFWEKGHSL